MVTMKTAWDLKIGDTIELKVDKTNSEWRVTDILKMPHDKAKLRLHLKNTRTGLTMSYGTRRSRRLRVVTKEKEQGQ